MGKHLHIISRKDAISIGMKRYFTGKPCKRGHISERFTSRPCVECAIDRKSTDEYKSKKKNLDKNYYEKHRSEINERNKKYRIKNKEKFRGYYKKRHEKGKKCPEYKAAKALRASITNLYTRIGTKKEGSSSKLLGYSAIEFKHHIERQFHHGMTWENYGEWHIDHITPVAEFIKRGELDPSVINALPNLKPEWARDNIQKSDKVLYLI